MSSQGTLEYHFHSIAAGSIDPAVMHGGGCGQPEVKSPRKQADTKTDTQGKTLPLPLFGETEEALGAKRPITPADGSMQQPTPKGGHKQNNRQQVATSMAVDQHMQAAWKIAKALKTGKWRSATLKSTQAREDLFQTSDTKRQFGIAICEHLRASLQQQMAWEQRSLAKQHAQQQQ